MAGGLSGHLASMLLISKHPNTYFYCNSLKGLFSYKIIMQEKGVNNSTNVIHKNNNCEIKIMNEIKLAIYKSVS